MLNAPGRRLNAPTPAGGGAGPEPAEKPPRRAPPKKMELEPGGELAFTPAFENVRAARRLRIRKNPCEYGLLGNHERPSGLGGLEMLDVPRTPPDPSMLFFFNKETASAGRHRNRSNPEVSAVRPPRLLVSTLSQRDDSWSMPTLLSHLNAARLLCKTNYFRRNCDVFIDKPVGRLLSSALRLIPAWKLPSVHPSIA